MKLAVAAMILAAGITAPATAYADCGDPGQDPCTGPVPTVDQVLAIMTELTDPKIPAANKGDIVTPEFTDEQAGKFDKHAEFDERRRNDTATCSAVKSR